MIEVTVITRIGRRVMSKQLHSLVLLCVLAVLWLVCWTLSYGWHSVVEPEVPIPASSSSGAGRSNPVDANEARDSQVAVRRESAMLAEVAVLTVRDENGDAVEGATVSLSSRRAVVLDVADISKIGICDDRGQFSIQAGRVQRGSTLVVEKDGFVPSSLVVSAQLDYVTVLHRAACLQVRAAGEDEVPLSDVVIVAYDKSATAGVMRWRSDDMMTVFSGLSSCCAGRTGPDGCARLAVPRGRYSIAAFARDRVMAAVPQAADLSQGGTVEREVRMAWLGGRVCEFVDGTGRELSVLAHAVQVETDGVAINNVFARMQRSAIKTTMARATASSHTVVVLDATASRPSPSVFGKAVVWAWLDGAGIVRTTMDLLRWGTGSPHRVVVEESGKMLGVLRIDAVPEIRNVVEEGLGIVCLDNDTGRQMVMRPKCGVSLRVPTGVYEVIRLFDKKVVKRVSVSPDDGSGLVMLEAVDVGPHILISVKLSSGEIPYGCVVNVAREGVGGSQRLAPPDPSCLVIPVESGTYSVTVTCGDVVRQFPGIHVDNGVTVVNCLLEV